MPKHDTVMKFYMAAFRTALFAGLCALCLPALVGQARAAEAPQCPQHVDVRNQMTVTEFNRAGLEKLDTKQLKALNAWLTRYVRAHCGKREKSTEAAGAPPVSKNGSESTSPPPGAASPPPEEVPSPPVRSEKSKPQTPRQETETPSQSTASAQGRFGKPPPKPKTSDRIESRITGDFYGWTGNTVFKLENGQVWQQAGPGYFRIHLKSPKVVVKKLLIGYVLLVEGYSKEVFVRRVQ